MRLSPLLVFLLPCVSWASDPSHAINQAKHFVKKGWLDDAVRELEEAAQSEEGKTSFEVHAMLAQIHYQQADADRTLAAGRRALEVSTDPSTATETQRLVAFIESNFGTLNLVSPYPGMESRLEIESETPILDPELQRFTGSLKQRLSEKTALPLRVLFPAGRYSINGLEVEVRPNREAELVFTMTALGATGISALQVSRIELSTGTGMVASTRAPNLRPSLDVQFSISQPIGSWIIGTQLDYSLRTFSIEGEGLFQDPLAYTVGARFGREVLLGGPLSLRPSIGYRYGYLPGIELSCESSDPLDAFAGPYTCRNPDDADGDPDLRVYAIARTHLPFAELSLDYRQSGRSTAMGMGIKLIGEAVIGSIPEKDRATIKASDETVQYSATDTTIRGASVRMLANFSFAF